MRNRIDRSQETREPLATVPAPSAEGEPGDESSTPWSILSWPADLAELAWALAERWSHVRSLFRGRLRRRERSC